MIEFEAGCKKEIKEQILGAKLIEFDILTLPEAYNTDEEIFLQFSNGKEIRIYIHEDGKLMIYSD